MGWAAAACQAWVGFQAWAAWEVGAAAEEEADDEADVAERSASGDSGVGRSRILRIHYGLARAAAFA